MRDSILDTTKKVLGIDPDYDAFDLDIVTHINSALFALTQMGVGPPGGFEITGSTETWADFLGDTKQWNGVKTLVYLKVRLVFDPPANSSLYSAMKEQMSELEWRLNYHHEVSK